MKEIIKPIIVEQEFNKPIELVWKAITDQEEMIKWFFKEIEAFDSVVGFETQFNVHSGGRDFLHHWKIMEVVPNRKIVYSWKYPAYTGEGIVTFELLKKESQTILRLTAEGMETFPQDIPEFTRESCQGGWNYFIGSSLKDYLDK